MKRINSRSINRYGLGLIIGAALSGCAEQSPYSTQQTQCLAVLKTHTAFAQLTGHKESLSQQQLSLAFEFEVNSVFGPKAATGKCIYALNQDHPAAMPLSIQIGNTLHTDPASIADLIAGDSLNGRREDTDHKH